MAAQIERLPRTPWRVVARCEWGYPTVIWSPSRLDDGTPFPNLAWLTCPYLIVAVGALESTGLLREWTERISDDTRLQRALEMTDKEVRASRRIESAGDDACASVGIAGQKIPTAMKCLHAHVALSLSGIDDVVGDDVLALTGRLCPDSRCQRLLDSDSDTGGGTST